MLKLVIQDDEGKTTVVPLVRDEITIGRREGNTIRLTERNVSRRHARLRRANGAITIEDLESYNGVRVNGNLIEGERSFGESDRVQIGDYLIELRAEEVERADSEQATQRIERIDPAEVAADAADEDSEAHTVPLPKKLQDPSAAPAPASPSATAKSSPPPAPAARAPSPVPASEPEEPAPEVKRHGKLVVLSTSYAGREFVLDKPSVVIGRTEDNDVCVDHRSISRHHAKVVREDGRYAIVDLQSSNGVRVNGEEYGKVELRRGDVVDLGHVRMRYVEPGEDFVFGRDAHPVDLESGRRRGALWAAAAVAVLVGGVGLYALTGGDEGATAQEEPSAAIATGDDGSEEPVATVVTEDAATASSDEVAEDDAALIQRHLEAADEAVTADDWEQARDEARAALDIDPDEERALELATRAETELENRERYDAFMDAVEAGDYREVAATFDSIDRESVYRVKGQPEHDRMRDEYVEQTERRARRAARRGQCDQLRRIAADARSIWPEAGSAVAGIPCRQRVADASSERTETGEPDPPDQQDEPTRQPSGQQAGGSQPPVSEVVEEAQAAARSGEYARALRLCEDALRRSRGHSQALMVCLISACNLRNVSKARHYMSQISGDQRLYARQICLRNGVDVE